MTWWYGCTAACCFSMSLASQTGRPSKFFLEFYCSGESWNSGHDGFGGVGRSSPCLITCLISPQPRPHPARAAGPAYLCQPLHTASFLFITCLSVICRQLFVIISQLFLKTIIFFRQQTSMFFCSFHILFPVYRTTLNLKNGAFISFYSYSVSSFRII